MSRNLTGRWYLIFLRIWYKQINKIVHSQKLSGDYRGQEKNAYPVSTKIQVKNGIGIKFHDESDTADT
jgi:hypothetical protein